MASGGAMTHQVQDRPKGVSLARFILVLVGPCSGILFRKGMCCVFHWIQNS